MGTAGTEGDWEHRDLLGSVHDVILERSGTGVAILDRDLRFRAVNLVAAETNGLPPEDHDGRTLGEVVPGVAGTLEPVLAQVFRTGRSVTDIEVVGSVPSSPQRNRHWKVSVVPVPGDPDHVAVVFVDITAQRWADQRLRNVMDSLFVFVGLLDTAGHVLEANKAALDAGGVVADDVIGRRFWDTSWWNWNHGVQRRLREAIEHASQGEPARYDELVFLREGRLTPIDFQLAPMFDGNQVVGLVTSAIDISQRVESTVKLEALAHLSGTLAGCTTTEEAVAEMVRHPASVEDAATLTAVVEGEGGQVTVHRSGEDPFVMRPSQAESPQLSASEDLSLALRCLAEAEPVVAEGPDAELLRSAPLCDESGGALGALVIRWSAPPELDPAAQSRVALVADLCSQALIRSARVDELSRLVDAVGRQVLGQDIDRPNLDVAIRYDASNEMARFGGDWFDVVEVGEHRTAFVLGDVAGHGAAAAGTMAHVKGLLRGLVMSAEAENLFDLATQGLAGPNPEMVATAAVSVIDTEISTLETVLAGHPPPLVRNPEGAVRRLDGMTRPPIGIPAVSGTDDEPQRIDCDFAPGSSLVLYSDGLVETRHRSPQEGIAQIEGVLAGLPTDADARQSADAVVSALATEDTEDDVALMVVRFRPEPGAPTTG